MQKDPANTKSSDLPRIVDASGNFYQGQELELFKMLDTSLDVAVSILDQNLDYTYISSSVYDELGFSRDEIGPGDPLSRCHELMCEKGLITRKLLEDRQLASKNLQDRNATAALASNDTVELANGTVQRLVRKNLPNGYTVSMATDVTELVEKERILESSLVLGRSGYWIYDLKNKTHSISQSVDKFTSKKVAQQIRKNGIIAFIHPEDRHLLKSAIKTLSSTNGRFEFTARVLSRLDDEEFWCVFTGNAVRNKAGDWHKLRTFIKDVTTTRTQSKALEIAKDEALAASQAKSQFLANMSHEIRTPMNGVLGMAELLSSSNIDDRQREFVNVIMQSSSALLTIINDILDFSKIEAGALTLDPLPLNFRDIVNDVAKLLTNNDATKDVELVVNYPTGLPCGFIADAGRLRQILMNLVGNALKFTKKGHVMIDVNIEPSQETHANITVRIEDTGIGIEADKIKSIFNKFTQADGSTTRVYGGTGLGLSITKHLVEMMEGDVFVESELGVGSTFGFNIPLQIDKTAKIDVYDTRSLVGKRVLIVDDIDVNCRILSERLKFWSMDSETAKDCVQAVAKLKEAQARNAPFDLILLDFLMPGMNGLEFAAHMQSQTSIKMCPIIMLSSVDQSKTTPELKKMGVSLYLTKPVRESRLHEAMVQIMSEATASITQESVTRAPTVTKPVLAEPRVRQPVPAQKISDLAEVSLESFSTSVIDDAIAQFGDALFEPQLETELSDRALTARPAPAQPATNKIQILVAEDFQLNQDVVRLMLSGTNFEPTFANNGQEAVTLYQENPVKYQAIIMDVSMPVMDGYEATRKIQMYNREHDIAQIPIIALTGHALSHDRQLCIDAGMDDYMTKPIQQALLMERLNHHIGLTDDQTRASA